MEDATVVAETGARAGAAARVQRGARSAEQQHRGDGAPFARGLRRARRPSRRRPRTRDGVADGHAARAGLRARRAGAGVAGGHGCPLGRLREAWVVHRYGLAEVVNAGAAAAGAPRPELTRRVGEAIGLYEAHAEQRPPGWPQSGAAALCVLAAQRRADRLAGDVARLAGLARGCARPPPSTTRRASQGRGREPSAGSPATGGAVRVPGRAHAAPAPGVGGAATSARPRRAAAGRRGPGGLAQRRARRPAPPRRPLPRRDRARARGPRPVRGARRCRRSRAPLPRRARPRPLATPAPRLDQHPGSKEAPTP